MEEEKKIGQGLLGEQQHKQDVEVSVRGKQVEVSSGQLLPSPGTSWDPGSQGPWVSIRGERGGWVGHDRIWPEPHLARICVLFGQMCSCTGWVCLCLCVVFLGVFNIFWTCSTFFGCVQHFWRVQLFVGCVPHFLPLFFARTAGPPSVGPPLRRTAKKIALFLPLPPQFSSFLSLGVVFFKAGDPQRCTFGLSGSAITSEGGHKLVSLASWAP